MFTLKVDKNLQAAEAATNLREEVGMRGKKANDTRKEAHQKDRENTQSTRYTIDGSEATVATAEFTEAHIWHAKKTLGLSMASMRVMKNQCTA